MSQSVLRGDGYSVSVKAEVGMLTNFRRLSTTPQIINPLGFPLDRKVLLNSNHVMPLVGFGTFQGEHRKPGLCKAAVLSALEIGYRHIDTAYSYEIEDEVGEALREAIMNGLVRREELFVTTKLHQTFHRPEDVIVGLERSLQKLGLEYIDLFLMHFPHAYEPDENLETKRHPGTDKPLVDHNMTCKYVDTWKAMQGLIGPHVRSIGISNFNILKMKKLLAESEIVPAVNQIELHPYLPQRKLLAFCKENGIHVTAHSPLGGAPATVVAMNTDKGRPLNDPLILEIAKKYSIQPSQIILSWALQRGTSIVPKSTSPKRISLNAELVELAKDDFEKIENLKAEGEEIRFNNHRDVIGFDIYDEEVEDRPVEGSTA